MPELKEYGLLVERTMKYGTEYIIARVVSRNGDKPYGCSNDGEHDGYEGSVPKAVQGLQLDGLTMQGFVSDLNEFQFIGFEPEYRDVYSVDLRKADRMAKTLRKVVSASRKDSAYEAGDVFLSLAKTLKLSFVCYERDGREVSWDEGRWRFVSIEDGRNYYRRLIETTQKEARERKGVKVPA
jgi:hypothetical protein